MLGFAAAVNRSRGVNIFVLAGRRRHVESRIIGHYGQRFQSSCEVQTPGFYVNLAETM
jgi:hypothetical protein